MDELSVEDQEIVDILESYHRARSTELEANGMDNSALWHFQSAEWIKLNAKDVILKAKAYKKVHKD